MHTGIAKAVRRAQIMAVVLLATACWLGTAAAQTISTVAGNGELYGNAVGDGSQATVVGLLPQSAQLGPGGNLYILSSGRIRKVVPSGVISTVAGNGSGNDDGDGGLAVNAGLGDAQSFAVDKDGNLYIASNHRVRKISAASGAIFTIAGVRGSPGASGDGGSAMSALLANPQGIVVDASGNIYVAEVSTSRVRKITPANTISTVAGNGVQGFAGDGGVATAASLNVPIRLAVDAAGNLYISDRDNFRIRKVTVAGIISTVAGNGVNGFSGDGGPAVQAAVIPNALSIDSAGNIYIGDLGNSRVRMVTPGGTIVTVAGTGIADFNGDGGYADQSNVWPLDVSVAADGTLYIAESVNGRVRKVTPGTVPAVTAGNYIDTYAGTGVPGFSGDGGPARAAQLANPMGSAFDASGSLVFADYMNSRIRRVGTDGTITTIAGGDPGFAGDGGPAASAQFQGPMGVTADGAGNLYVVDAGNHRIRRIAPNGVISTVAGSGVAGYSGDGGPATAARLNTPVAVAVDGAGNLYIADGNNKSIRRVATNGVISTVAGSPYTLELADGLPATVANFAPADVAVDSSGAVYVADARYNRVRRFTVGGTISTVAGNGSTGGDGDGGPATSASLRGMSKIEFDASGALYIGGGRQVRKVTNGIISTVAGNGTTLAEWTRRDGGDPREATFGAISGLSIAANGDVFITDESDARIRRIGRPLLPSAPRSVVATAGDGQATLTFAPPLSLGGSHLIRYEIVSDPAGGVDSPVSPRALVRVISGLENGSTYQFSVRAVTQVGAGPFSPVSNIVTPRPAPTVKLAIQDTSVLEANAGNSLMRFTLRLSAPAPRGGVSMDVTTVTSPFTFDGIDYLPTSVVGLTIPAGKTTVEFVVPVPGNTFVNNPLRSVRAVVSNVVNAILVDGEATGQIIDDDTAVYSPYVNFVAGNGTTEDNDFFDAPGYSGFTRPGSMALDSAGRLVIPDTGRWRLRQIVNSRISTIAGDSTPGFSGDGGPSAAARIGEVRSVAFDSQDNLYLADGDNHRIRRIAAGSGIISTVVGDGSDGDAGDGGQAMSASLGSALSIAFDSQDNLYIADATHHRIRKVSLQSGTIGPVAGQGSGGFAGDGGPAVNAILNAPRAIKLDAAGNLYIADTANQRVRKVAAATGTISTIAGNGTAGFSGDGADANSAQLNTPSGVAIDAVGNIYVSDRNNHRIRKVDAVSGRISTVAGTGSTYVRYDVSDAGTMSIPAPEELLFDHAGSLFYAETGSNRIRMVRFLAVPQAPRAVAALAGDAKATVQVTPWKDLGNVNAFVDYVVTADPADGADAQAGTDALVHEIGNLVGGTSYRFSVRAKTGAGVGPARLTAPVVTSGTGLPALSVSDGSVTEGNKGITSIGFVVSLTAPAPVGGVTFDIEAIALAGTGGFATTDLDFLTPGVVERTIPAGDSSLTYYVKVVSDTRVEGNESFAVHVSNIRGARNGSLSAIGTIIDDDAITPAVTSVTVDGPTASTPTDGTGASGETLVPISAIQGSGRQSPQVGQQVRTRGIVTARVRDGFYLQSEDNRRDADPSTSEGLFIYTRTAPPASAERGNRVLVSGQVQEIVLGAAPGQLTLTSLVADTISLVDRGNALPVPVTFDAAASRRSNSLVGFERFEGMRFSVPSLTVVGPTQGQRTAVNGALVPDGVIMAVPTGIARPFREPGRDPLDVAVYAGPLPRFSDGNPERLRIDSTAQAGAKPIAADVGDVLAGARGVLSYSTGNYSLLLDAVDHVAVRGTISPRAVALARPSEATIGYLGLSQPIAVQGGKRLAVEASSLRLLRTAKTANAVCAYLHAPAVLALTGVDSRSSLVDLAAAVNDTTGNVLFPGACHGDAGYDALMATAGSGPGTGFLVSTALVRPGVPRVAVTSVIALGADKRLVHRDGSSEPLFAQPPSLAVLRINQAQGGAVDVTAVVVALSPLPSGDGREPGPHGWATQASYAVAKRDAQSRFLAETFAARRKLHPQEKVVLLGGFESPQFPDGQGDALGRLAALGDERSLPRGEFRNLTWRLSQGKRYSAVVRGDAQALDHVLVNRALDAAIGSLRVDVARINADFGEDNGGDARVPVRVSARDPFVLYLEALPAGQ